MSAVDVAAIRARAEAATEGPWRVVGRYVALIGPVGVAQGQPAIDALTETDAEFIAAARTDVPALCDEVERLREQRNALVNEAHDWIAVAKSNEADLAAARATLARVKALTDEWDSNPDSDCTLGWAADRLNAALSSPESPAVSARSEDVDVEAAARILYVTRSTSERVEREQAWDSGALLPTTFARYREQACTVLAALSAPVLGSEGVDVEATITRVATEHCLQQGAGGFHSWRCDYPDRYGECDCLAEFVADLTAALSAPVPDDEPFYVLCTRPYDPDHRHRAAPVSDVAAINVVFDGPPGPESGRFVEVEDDNGHARRVGQWTEGEDGLWSLRIALPDVAAERVAAIKAEALREARAFVGSASRPNRAEIDRWLSRQIKDCDRAAALTADATDGGVSRAATTPDQQGEGES